MDEETDSSLVPVPLDLARGDVDLGEEVTSWSLTSSLALSDLSRLGGGVRSQAGVRLVSQSQEVAALATTATTVPSLQDSRLVGVPTMGRVIPMSDLSRLGIPEMRIVLQSETKLEDDLENLGSLPVMSDSVMTVSESTGLLMRTDSHSLEDLQEIASRTDLLHPVSAMPAPVVTSSSLTNMTSLHHLPRDRAVRDKTFPGAVLHKFVAEYKSGALYDTVWECHGARFKTHKLVLASASSLLRQLLLAEVEEGTKSVVSTPDLSVQCVKSLLCLFYTGKVNITNEITGEINSAFKMLQFRGSNVTLLPTNNIIKQESEAEDPATLCQAETERRRRCGDSDSDWDPRTDLAFEEEIQGDEQVEEGDWWEPRGKKRKSSLVKNEKWSDEEDTKSYSGFKRGRKSLKTPDTHEIYRTRGPGKGDRSYQLSLDLFDGRAVDFIHVCHSKLDFPSRDFTFIFYLQFVTKYLTDTRSSAFTRTTPTLTTPAEETATPPTARSSIAGNVLRSSPSNTSPGSVNTSSSAVRTMISPTVWSARRMLRVNQRTRLTTGGECEVRREQSRWRPPSSH